MTTEGPNVRRSFRRWDQQEALHPPADQSGCPVKSWFHGFWHWFVGVGVSAPEQAVARSNRAGPI